MGVASLRQSPSLRLNTCVVGAAALAQFHSREVGCRFHSVWEGFSVVWWFLVPPFISYLSDISFYSGIFNFYVIMIFKPLQTECPNHINSFKHIS